MAVSRWDFRSCCGFTFCSSGSISPIRAPRMGCMNPRCCGALRASIWAARLHRDDDPPFSGTSWRRMSYAARYSTRSIILAAPLSTKNRKRSRDASNEEQQAVVFRRQGEHRRGLQRSDCALGVHLGGFRIRRAHAARSVARRGEEGLGRRGYQGQCR